MTIEHEITNLTIESLNWTAATTASFLTALSVSRIAVGAVLLAPIDDKYGILMLRRVVNDEFGGIEELPSGAVESAETLGEALVREVREETSLQVDNYLSFGFIFTYQSRFGRTVQLNYVAVLKSPMEVQINPTEHSSYRWMVADEMSHSRVTESVKNGVLSVLDRGLIEPGA